VHLCVSYDGSPSTPTGVLMDTDCSLGEVGTKIFIHNLDKRQS
jgi:hypothetical protein